jgi:hypothetical protein
VGGELHRLPGSPGGGGDIVESKRNKMNQLNYLPIQGKENTRLIDKQKTILCEAEYNNQVRSRLPGLELGLLLTMGAGMGHWGYKPPA